MAGSLTELATHAFTYSSFHLSENGLTPLGTPTKAEWLTCGRFLRHAEASVHFWLGDWLRYGEAHFKDDYKEAIEVTGYSYHTLRRDKYLAERIPIERRRSHIDVAIHHELAPLDEATQETLFQKVHQENLTVQQLRMEKHRLFYETKRTPPTELTPGLFFGDCRQILTTLPDNSIDLLLTDPPYGLNYQSEHKILLQDRLLNDGPDEALTMLDETLAIAQHKVKDNSHIYIFSSWKTYPAMQEVISRYFAIKNVLVWVKNNWTSGDLEANYGQIHEFIIFAHKGRRHLNGRRDSSVLTFNRVPENYPQRHPTQKPEKLLAYLIEKSTQPGETVLDPFMGSGSTCVAAHNSDRKFIGIELDEQWYTRACERLEKKDTTPATNVDIHIPLTLETIPSY
jgi:site-specific DNA-methyltransferase (adenine-specific)